MKLQVMSLMSIREVQRTALTLIELLIVLLCLGIVVVVLFPALYSPKTRAPRLICVNNLKQIGLSFRAWALDHAGEFPMRAAITNGGAMGVPLGNLAYASFTVMSNELSNPAALICSADNKRIAAADFRGIGSANLSYFVGLDASGTNAHMFLAGDDSLLVNGFPPNPGLLLNLTTNSTIAWSKTRHQGQGNIGLADGSVQMLNSATLAKALANSGSPSNRIIFP